MRAQPAWVIRESSGTNDKPETCVLRHSSGWDIRLLAGVDDVLCYLLLGGLSCAATLTRTEPAIAPATEGNMVRVF